MEKKFTIKRPHYEDESEKHYRFSIRKFNVGVASVAISAFILIFGGGASIAADSVSDATSSDQVVEVEQLSGDTTSDAVTNLTAADTSTQESAPQVTEASDGEQTTAATSETPAAEETNTPETVTVDTAVLTENANPDSDQVATNLTDSGSNDALTTSLRAVAPQTAEIRTPSTDGVNNPTKESEWIVKPDGSVTSETGATNEATDESVNNAKEKAGVYNRAIASDLTYAVLSPDGSKIPIDANSFALDPNPGRVTILVGYLGDPYDVIAGVTNTDDAHVTSDDYNERNNLEYYITASLEPSSGGRIIYLNLVDKADNNKIVETKTLDIDNPSTVTFATLDAIQVTTEKAEPTTGATNGKYNLNYVMSLQGSEDSGYNLNISATVMEGFVTSDEGHNHTWSVNDTSVGCNNQSVYIYNLSEPMREGSAVNHFNVRIPQGTEQNNYYYAVDSETYQAYLKNDSTYLDQATGNETLLAHLKQYGYIGQVYEIADALDFSDYELVETPYDNMKFINGLLMGEYTVGSRIQVGNGNNGIKRIVQFDSETGAVHFEVWMLDINKEGWSSYHYQTYPVEEQEEQKRRIDSIVDPEELEKAYTLIYSTKSIESPSYNEEWYIMDLNDPNGDGNTSDSMIAQERRELSAVKDANPEQIKTDVESGKNSTTVNNMRYVHTQPGSTGWTYGQLRIPIAVGRTNTVIDGDKEVTGIQIGGTSQNLQNSYEENLQNVHWYYVEKGNVIVHYEDTEGNVIAVPQVDTEHGDSGTEYNTADDLKPATIVAEDGTVYYLVTKDDDKVVNGVKQTLAEDSTVNNKLSTYTTDETGTVEAGVDKNITYVYQKGGNVVVRYHGVDKDGNVTGVIADEREDTAYTAPETEYNTTDLRPTRIATSDGKIYQLVSVNNTNPHIYTDGELADGESTDAFISGGESGNVTAEKTTVINYYYEEVTGDVNVHYFAVDENGDVMTFDDGQPLAESVVDTKGGSVSDLYDTTDHKPDYIVRVISVDENGNEVTETFKRVDINNTNPHAVTDGDSEVGKVAEGSKDVNYYYELVKGDVYVHYYAVDKDGNRIDFPDGSPLAESQVDTREGSIDSDYDTTDFKPDTIVKDGVTYKRVDINNTNPHAVTDGD
ncbi:signal peptide-containing protein, YSIRK family, partial [Streptococcus equinus]